MSSVRFASDNGSDNFFGRAMPRAPEDPHVPTAPELWTQKHIGVPKPRTPPYDPSAIFSHPLYTPPSSVDISVGPLIPPLALPEFDQSRPTLAQNPRLSKFYAYKHEQFGGVDDPLGGYPRLPMQWAHLKDPYKYWDQQGRRNYGDLLYEHENLTDQMSFVGPTLDPSAFYQGVFQVFLTIGIVYTFIAYYNPEKNLWMAEKDYPFDGLRIELGGDPNNKDDFVHPARRYEDQYK